MHAIYIRGNWPAFETVVEPTKSYTAAFYAYLRTLKEVTPATPQTSRVRAKLHELTTEVLWRYTDSWEEPNKDQGLNGVVQGFDMHFAQRDTWKLYHRQAWEEPKRGELYIQLDFAEHHSLPIGPTVPGSAWYAKRRLGVTVMGFMVWEVDRRQSQIYLTTVKEQGGKCGETKTLFIYKLIY